MFDRSTNQTANPQTNSQFNTNSIYNQLLTPITDLTKNLFQRYATQSGRPSDDYLIPVQFNKDYSIVTYNNSAYLKQKLLKLKKEYKAFTLTNGNQGEINNDLSSHFDTAAGSLIGQIKAAKLGLMNSIVGSSGVSSPTSNGFGLNEFAVSNKLIEATIFAQNRESFLTLKSMSTSMLCLNTVCLPSNPVDIVNNLEFVQCSLSCLSDPKSALGYYVFKNFNGLTENLQYKKEFTSKLQSQLTTGLVNEGLDNICRAGSGLPIEQVQEIENFRRTHFPKRN